MIEEKSLEGIEEMKEQRRLHYDTHLWQTTSIFIGVIAVMFSLVSSTDYNESMIVLIVGFSVTLIAFYFAVSFRELRYRLDKSESEKGLGKSTIPMVAIRIVIYNIRSCMDIVAHRKFTRT